MALTNFDELYKSIVDWSHRGDLGVKIPDFISLTENAMYSNDAEVLTVRSMETISTALTAGQYLSLPDNFESARSVRLVTDGGGGELRFQAPEQMRKRVAGGRPSFFSVVGNEIQFDRVPDSEYTIEIQYYRKATPLTEANQTNDILTNHPNIYLYGALAQAFSYSQDDQQAGKYVQLFIGAIKGANKADKKGRYGPAPAMSVECGMIV
tara:strand:+ start:294 stop:920 length:627 start_codon:yes stop_codon:yes gene_type:complete